MSTAPLVGRMIDGLLPWIATFIGITMIIVSQVIQTAAGQVSVGAVIVATFGECERGGKAERRNGGDRYE